MNEELPLDRDIAPPAFATHVVMHQVPRSYKGVIKASWILIIIACGLALIPLLGFASWLIAGPVFLTTFILSIIAMSRGGTVPGILVLLTSIIVGPIFVVIAPFVSSAIGIAGTGAAMSQNPNHQPMGIHQSP